MPNGRAYWYMPVHLGNNCPIFISFESGIVISQVTKFENGYLGPDIVTSVTKFYDVHVRCVT